LGKNIIKILFTFIIILLFVSNSTAQNFSPDNQLDSTKFQMTKSPWGAVLRSAILPGFGQFYNESYWKIPVVWGALGYLAYLWNDSNNKYKKYRDLYSEDVNNQTYLIYREFYKDQRDLNAVFIGLAYFLNLVDAFVDAHLFDFNVSEEMNSNKLSLSFKVRF
jgi:TM2 domain-containing membrane protein YozV